MFIAVTKLYQSINDKINEMRQPDRKVALVKEWDDLFVEGAQNNLAKIWLNLAGRNSLLAIKPVKFEVSH